MRHVLHALHVVAVLGIADLLADGPRTSDELAHVIEGAISGLRRFDATATLTVHRSLNAVGVEQMALPKSRSVVFRPACS
jgi:hypothetical protein